ncbi:Rossmann-fold NAD(P)-binding domain-containing protein [Verminephrobacter aporrectodeae]|uniref:C-methyltransferase domain-containing protein n=1 Tax=Verminephrobacter aporrectodeae subsp. tuberculatae TaxID=1110392 RepID=A0ABT3KT15_9BURK|nr:hypothetical protein [Verminephrobacter aporrectodeae]MCW5321468.1 hypothetical protein [Verminephrobacter aporrectodeae subsp. tuberculatae]MCW8174070.1 hypothetical protein [Verminephrobacter aporrectodeae subsp. tuberculatae]MCW8197918.1 hypothetical protein [Verminephrobacter aporrectodeae subsp. tuberculatae]MCW8201645.1 hypothetical protein [Verminephrobacter aporrectodeae subsp. tuberculatae]MCW8209746.1 hypothetical protein [Verminephrobacter aporrectodeae subsp. tuberculatae]
MLDVHATAQISPWADIADSVRGSRIVVVDEEYLRTQRTQRTQRVLILPWNLREELTRQLGCVRAWGGRFVPAVPRLEVL